MDRLNESGKLFLTHTKVDGKLTLRMAIGQTNTDWPHVRDAGPRLPPPRRRSLRRRGEREQLVVRRVVTADRRMNNCRMIALRSANDDTCFCAGPQSPTRQRRTITGQLPATDPLDQRRDVVPGGVLLDEPRIKRVVSPAASRFHHGAVILWIDARMNGIAGGQHVAAPGRRLWQSFLGPQPRHRPGCRAGGVPCNRCCRSAPAADRTGASLLQCPSWQAAPADRGRQCRPR